MSETPKYHLHERFNPTQAHPDESHSVQARLLPTGAKVLELGCASGYMSAYLEQEKGCQVVGLDNDPSAIAIARTRCHAAYVADLESPDALAVAQPHAPFDVIYAANVLEHIRSAEAILHSARQMLRPGGQLLLVLPNVAHWRSRLNLLLGRFDYTDYGLMDRTHVHFYTLASARALLEGCVFAVERLAIAGSFVQNRLNQRARQRQQAEPTPFWPELLAYEMIFLARAAR